jgi:sugar lactone lactonase YvrE
MKRVKLIFVLTLFVVSACTIQKSKEVELVIDSRSDLGEGAIWNSQTGELLWINITGKILNIYNPKTGNN